MRAVPGLAGIALDLDPPLLAALLGVLWNGEGEDAVVLAAGGAEGNNPRTKMASPTVSVRQVASGANAGAQVAAPLRRSKQAWCQGQWMWSPSTRPSASGAP